MFAAISGLKNHQTMLDVTANDIANVNTVGYKSARTTFKDSLSQLQRGGAAPSAAQGGANPAQVGLGSQLSSIDNVMTTGTFQSTGSATDVGVQGEGFFVLAPDAAERRQPDGPAPVHARRQLHHQRPA
jgi:flagellar hook protein FlgE